jgi:3-hydroxy-9,10-secoandrosta-1,3,5(10)-triene-9,17-dione monooxygenase reductase component
MSSTANPARLDPAVFRRVLGHVPTAVSVVTAIGPTGPVGMTVGSFTSVSLDPALVGFFATSTSRSLRSVQDGGRFTANVLADFQSGLSQRFAGRSEDKFDDIVWTPSPTGTPRLAGALAWIDCRVTSSVEFGDHIAVIGAVDALDVVQHSGRPLVFFRGRYCHLDSRTLPRHENWRLDHYAEW